MWIPTGPEMERVVRDVTRVVRGQLALFAVVDTLVKTFLTCVPARRRTRCHNRWHAPGTGMPAS